MTEISIHDALAIFMDQAPLPFAVTRGAEHTLAYANAAFYHLASVSRGSALGAPIASALANAHGTALRTVLGRAFHDGQALIDEPIDAPGETPGAWLYSVWPVSSGDGPPEYVGIEIRHSGPADLAMRLQRQIAEQMLLGALRERGHAEDAEAARKRVAFLAETSRLLAEAVDHTSTLATLAKLALPTLGAWCIVDLLREGGGIHRLGIYHPDPERQILALELEATWLPEPDDPFGAPAMLRDARTILITENMEATLAATAHSVGNLRILRQLGIGSLMTIPLVARKRLLGAITFVGGEHDSLKAPEDVQLAEDIAAHAALALDNAQVYDLALVLRRKAESANHAKTAFLGAMSHELRTPLNAIGGYIELLDMGLRGPVSDAQRADFARVRTNQQHLTLLITEILNFVRVGSGRVSYQLSDVIASDALARAIEMVEPLFAQKGLIYEGSCDDSSIVARADPEKVTQILVNLLSNAIKFTGEGGTITTTCSVAGDSVMVNVSDTGVGIPTDKLETVFEPFVQLKEGLAHRETGVGLGLAISRDLSHAMNGDLTVRSTEGHGTLFTLTLPRARVLAASEMRRRKGDV